MGLEKVVIITPFWRRANHLSAVRVERFVRWFAGAGVRVVLVRAGSADQAISREWGVEVAVRDPLGLHPDEGAASAIQGTREYSPLVTLAAALAFNPDPGILWARRAAKHPLVLEHGRGAGFVISSSPPESAHLAAASLAERLGAELAVDMRDGWLDEPLKPLLQKSRLQRWREGRLERRVIEQARVVFVTSTRWQALLEERLPQARGKVTVLTNCYPSPQLEVPFQPQPEEPYDLVYAGRFTGSKFDNRPGILLEPLFAGLRQVEGTFRVVILGALTSNDLEEIAPWREKFASVGVDLVTRPQVERTALAEILAKARGLLLLSATRASILAKLFDYIPTRRPILAITLKDSSVWDLSARVPQLFAVDMHDPAAGQSSVADFLMACATNEYAAEVPPEFGEEHNAGIFLRELSRSSK
ncbi:MAG: hypothetical protein HYS23_06300 [Geobacter sp.]|nr:hypothetical protein [Geobacter sp.]